MTHEVVKPKFPFSSQTIADRITQYDSEIYIKMSLEKCNFISFPVVNSVHFELIWQKYNGVFLARQKPGRHLADDDANVRKI